MNIVTINKGCEKRILEIWHIINDGICGDIYTLRLHVFCNATGGIEFACGVSNKTYVIMKKRNVSDVVALNHILEHNCIIDAWEIFPYFIFIVNTYRGKSWESTVIEIFP